VTKIGAEHGFTHHAAHYADNDAQLSMQFYDKDNPERSLTVIAFEKQQYETGQSQTQISLNLGGQQPRDLPKSAIPLKSYPWIKKG
jgi:hypothetical protein